MSERRPAAIGPCLCGDACESYAPGHRLHPIWARAAAATPSQWVDAVVEATSPDGFVELYAVLTGEHLVVWTHTDLSGYARRGDPVGLHRRYRVLGIGRERFSVALDVGPGAW